MAARASSQVQIETLISRGRTVLAVFTLVGLRVGSVRLDPEAMQIAWAFLAYALLLLLLTNTRAVESRHWPGATHAIDLAVYAAYLSQVGSLALPVLAWFLFVLIAATLRWGWRGTLTTGSVAVAVHVGIGARHAELIRDPAMTPAQFVVLALLMGVMTVLVGLVGAYEDWRGTQLARLAAWTGPDPDRPAALTVEILQQASAVLESPRTLMVWEQSDEPWTEVALWDNGKIEQFREPPGTFGDVVAERIAQVSFFCRNLTIEVPITYLRGRRGGVETWRGVPIDPGLRDRFQIRALAGWSLLGDDFRGWLFCLDRSAFSLQDLAVGDVVADLATARLSQSYLLQRLRDTAVATERLRLARDLHDGVLQTLTGAALQLQTARRLLALDPASSEERLSQVQRIIAAGQNDLRFFIHQLGPRRAADAGAPIDLRGRLHELADRVRRQWGVPVTVATEPETLEIPDLLVTDLFLLIHEALVNAARHAHASAIQLAIFREPHQISIAVADDGQGFPFKGSFSLEDLIRMQTGPRTLRERVASLGGDMLLETTDQGSRLKLTVPLAREVV